MDQSISFVERLHPGDDSPTYERNLRRYKLASESIRGSATVLDVACGAGHGSALLAKEGGMVVGVDLSMDTLQYCRREYIGSATHFVLMDAHNLAFANGCFDAVVTLETIEHLRDPDGFVAEIARIISDTGTVILSTPNRAKPVFRTLKTE